ncbi:N-acyl homoserine lactonase AttM [Beijerinckia sp. L45]|uniref:AttM family quorum-quenching N-acyl homoserine lactonase n=1 Tax=Beijerinckia sp. L45 TaxID=1641855 RepID=UPI00131E6B7B|nr:N-acyl homoserine lactonase family protein [Beijerinckia sp. L45]
MSDIRLTIFQTGTLRCKYHDVYLNQGIGQDFEIPVPWYLITHPRGNVVIDGGIPSGCVQDPKAYWGVAADYFWPQVGANEHCLAQIDAAGVDPASVTTVLLSHLHLDHTGAIGRFPNATHVVQRTEFEYALAPDWFCAAGFIRADFDRPELKWRLLEGAWGDFYDLYGDGSIICIRTPGHTLGHQSFLITTPRNRVLLAVDAADTMDHWEERALPGAVASVVDAVRSVRKLHAVRERADALVVAGHDSKQFASLKTAPDFY